jgi:hypothetical protein
MIDKVIDFIRKQINTYLHVKYNDLSNTDFIQLANVAWNDTNAADAANGNNSGPNAFITLINLEEDRISRPQENYVRNGNSVLYKNPKVYLNLYVLFAVNLASYTESLKRLSYIVQFFQYQNVFTPLNSPDLPAPAEELIADLITLNFQDLNNLWGILGSKYLPSVMYKIRLVIISEEFVQGAATPIQQVTINDKLIQQS